MLYIIGGVPRSGKTKVKKNLLDLHKVSGISTDIIREGLEAGFPDLGIREDVSDDEKTVKLWPFFNGIIDSWEGWDDSLVIEGTNFLPELLSTKLEKQYLKTCFLGYINVDVNQKLKDIRENPSEAEWTTDMSDEDLKKMIVYLVDRSKLLKEECEKYGIKYFDTSNNFNDVIDAATDYLLT